MPKTKIMGVVNVTPDSFSDGGDYDGVKHGQKLLEEGADILDIGGESTRPCAKTVYPDEEISRIKPVISSLKGAEISIDTRNAKTMQAAVEAGATMLNDVSALRYDPESVDVVSQSALPICIMHMQGAPEDMQNAPEYENVIDEICTFFEERLNFCKSNGIKEKNIILDPGIGFGKTLEHNLVILKNLHEFKRFGCKILLGVSRKSFIEKITGESDPKKRLGGSLSAALYNIEHVDILRVHDVWQTRQALSVFDAIDDVS